MQINWFTVIAQVINFFILVWLLKKYLYKPILSAIDEREKKIKDQLQDADARKAEAQKEQDDFKKKNADFDTEKKVLMEKAIAETNTERDKLLETARSEANNLQSKLEKASKDQQANLDLTIAQKTQSQVLAIARKTLADMASSSLEEQTVNVFIKRLNESNAEEKQHFIDAFKSNTNTILVQSAFDLNMKQQDDICNEVNKVLETETHLQFKTEPALISGIDLTTNGYKLAWSISEYLDSIEKKVLKPAAEAVKSVKAMI
jgi:F-type H+-transporting ATPase subunit b